MQTAAKHAGLMKADLYFGRKDGNCGTNHITDFRRGTPLCKLYRPKGRDCDHFGLK